MAQSLQGLHVELVAHDHGHWCNRCLLSTGVRSITALTVGMTVLRATQTLICTECLGNDIEVTPDAHHC